MSKKIVDQHLRGTLSASTVEFEIDNKKFSGAEFMLRLPQTKEEI